jgi:hypothetical protein
LVFAIAQGVDLGLVVAGQQFPFGIAQFGTNFG